MKFKDLKAGDKVRLVAGGPVMAVKEIREPDGPRSGPYGVHCQWFAGKKLDSGVFPPESLEIVTDDGQQKKN